MTAAAQEAPQTKPQAKPPLPTLVVTHPAAVLGCPVTRTVLFYTHGERGTDFESAVVDRNDSQGVLKLKVLKSGVITKHPVRHVDDPYFNDHPEVRRRDGAWDWGPADKPRGVENLARTIECAVPEIIRHWNNNITEPVEIANLVKGLLTVTLDGKTVLVEDPLTFVQVTLGEYCLSRAKK